MKNFILYIIIYNIMGDVPIYKIYKLVGINTIETIYIFNSNFKEYDEDELRNMFEENPMGEIFLNTFKLDEIEQIKKNNIKLEFIHENIYTDDSIGIVKLKIFEALNRQVSTDEIYLFSLIKDMINPVSSYQILTQNNKLPLTRIRLEQLLLNIYGINKELYNFELIDKDEYSYDDILNLNLQNDKFYLSQSLGQKIVFSSNYPFISNPYLVKEYDTLLENSRNELSSMNNNLLLDTPTIIDNILYICLAEDVFKYNEETDISTDYSCKIYFPFLYKDDIKSIDNLRENKNKLIQSSSNKMDLNMKKYLKSIQLFYEIYKKRNPSRNYNQIIEKTGINYFKIVIYPEYDIVIPVDVIFKIMHSTKNNPLIKFNPSFKQENIYRLYADEVTSDGKKIPHISIAKINDLKQKIGKNKSVSIYSVINYNHVNYEMIFEIDMNAHIMIYPFRVLDVPILFELKQNIFENIDRLISSTFKPIVEEIKHIFEQSGITLPTFTSIYSNNIEIRELKYQTVYIINKPFNLNKYKTCVSTIFNFEKNVGDNKYELRFKRVSNFNKYTNQEAYVMEQLEEGTSFEDIQRGLLENYKDLEPSDATEIISKIIRYIELTRGSKRKRNLIIRNNPGFPSTFKFNKHDGTLIIDIEKINNIYYLNTLRIYLDSIIRIVQEPSSISEKNMRICIDTDKISDVNFEDINSRSEEGILSNRVPDIVNDMPIYSEYREVRDEDTNINELVDIFAELEQSESETEDDNFNFDGGMNSEKIETNSSNRMKKNIRYDKFTIPKVDLAPSKKNVVTLKGKKYVKMNKNQLRNIIGYAIAKSLSRYMNIIEGLIDEAKQVPDSEELNSIVNSFNILSSFMNSEYEKNLNDFLSIGGKEEETIFQNYYGINSVDVLGDSEFDSDIKKNIFKYNKQRIKASEWENKFKDKIYKIINSNSRNIENLINFYKSNKKTKINLDKTYYDEVFPVYDDNLSSDELSSSDEVSSDEETKPTLSLKKKSNLSFDDESDEETKPSLLLKKKNTLLFDNESDEEVSSVNESEDELLSPDESEEETDEVNFSLSKKPQSKSFSFDDEAEEEEELTFPSAQIKNKLLEEEQEVEELPKSTKRVSIVSPKKTDMLELIGYDIARTFSKYINILTNIINDASSIKPNNKNDEETIKKIINDFNPLLQKLKEKEKKYKTEYVEIGGNLSSLNIDNYEDALIHDIFSFNVDDDNNIHLIYHEEEKKPKTWIGSIIKKINKKMLKNINRIDELIENYKKGSETEDFFLNKKINYDSDNLSEISNDDEEINFPGKVNIIEEEKDNLEMSDDESIDEDLEMLLKKEEETTPIIIEEDQPIVNAFTDVDVSKLKSNIIDKSSSSSDIESTEPEESSSDEDDIIEIIESNPDLEFPDEVDDSEDELEKEEEKEKEEELELELELEEEEQINVIDPTGMKISSPNYFTEQLKRKAKEIFGKSTLDNFDYTRSCNMTSSIRRQPVILTKKEKDRIMKEYSDDLNEENDFIKYSSDPTDESKTFYYMCPRFWCLKTNKMITEKDILEGKCGPKVSRVEDAIIPHDSSFVPKDKFVYEFVSKSGKKQFPGFHSRKRKYIDKNGKEREICVPCCFDILSSALNKRKDCGINAKNEMNELMTIVERKRQDELIIQSVKDKDDKYIKDGRSYGIQLPEYRRGLLPDVAQKFLHEVNDECIEKNHLKLNKKCLLRTGIEYSENKSFIACIANYLFYKKKYYNKKTKKTEPLITKYFPNSDKIEIPRVRQMIEIIIKSIKIDDYVKYQNGDLVNIFYSPDIEIERNIEQSYHKSKLYNQYKRMFEIQKTTRKLDQEEIDKKKKVKDFFNKVVNSLENFKKNLRNENSYIDYTYLWDIVCMPNKRLMRYGINMVILNILKSGDMTNDNIELICPTNHYQSHMYNSRKKTIIIIKNENVFEPVYLYEQTINKLEIVKYFSEYDRKLTKTLRSVFAKIIKPMLKDKCIPLTVYPKSKYKFKQPMLLDNLIKKLKNSNYTIRKQILNYEGKVIGVVAQDSELLIEGYIPCYPSALTSLTKEDVEPDCVENNSCEYEFAYMDDISWSQDYETTLNFLQHYYEWYDTNPSVPISCQDDEINGFCRVVEDGVISGFLTDANQFIPIKEPIMKQETRESNIIDIEYNSTYDVDSNILMAKSGDGNRAKFVKRVELETSYYNIFRNVIRILLNDYKNLNQRRLISNECNNKIKPYLDKLETVQELLHQLTDEYITFLSEEEGYNVDNIQIDKLKNCVNNDINKCGENTNLCMVMNNEKCGLIIPKNNLVTYKDNEKIYFGKIADELIRYNRISSFIFKPNSFLSFMKIKYKINSDEIILLENMITQEYFRELKSIGINKYRIGKTYDTSNPLITYNTYSNREILDDTLNPDYKKHYEVSQPTKIYNKYPRSMFPQNYNEVIYSGSHDCGLYLIIHLLKKFKGDKISISNIKELLLERYNYYTNNQQDKPRTINLISILNEEGQIDTNQLQDKTMSFRELIMSEGFIPTNFDLWILLTVLEIPSLFISIKFIAETRFNSREFATYYTDETTNMAIIIIPASFQRKRGVYPIYKLILNESNNEKIDVNVIQSSENLNSAIENKITIEKYLYEIFDKDNKTKYKGRKPGKRAFNELLEKDIVREGRDKEENYGISYEPGEYAKRMKELGISESDEELNFNVKRKPKKTTSSDTEEELSFKNKTLTKSESEMNEIRKKEQEEEQEEELHFKVSKFPKNITKKIVENVNNKKMNKTRKKLSKMYEEEIHF